MDGNHSLPRSARLRHPREIRRMFRGNRRACGSLDAFLCPAVGPDGPRIGVVVPRHGYTIVARNRLRRRIREILRTSWLPAQRNRERPRDLLVRARPEAYGRTFEELRADLATGLRADGC